MHLMATDNVSKKVFKCLQLRQYGTTGCQFRIPTEMQAMLKIEPLDFVIVSANDLGICFYKVDPKKMEDQEHMQALRDTLTELRTGRKRIDRNSESMELPLAETDATQAA